MKIDPENKEKNVILQLVSLEGKDILEIGCGDGRFSEILITEKINLTAIDKNVDMILKAKKHFAHNLNVNFLVCKGEEVNDFFKSRLFDLIFFSYSLHEHEDAYLTLKNASSLLKKNGQIIIIEPMHTGDLCQLIEPFFSEKNILLKTIEEIIIFPSAKKDYIVTNIKYHFNNREDFFNGLFKERITKNTNNAVVDKIISSLPSKNFFIRDKVVFWLIEKNFNSI
jgi:ubiquinone/menaquinone biosynthesis C-methylase UbiE